MVGVVVGDGMEVGKAVGVQVFRGVATLALLPR